MDEFYFETLETKGMLKFLNFDGKTSFPGLKQLSSDKRIDLDINFLKYDSASDLEKVTSGKLSGALKHTGKGSYCRFSNINNGKTFCFFDNNVSLDFIVYQGINKAFISLQDKLDIIFLHTAAVIIDEKLYLFFAPSGGGKTTICSLAEENGYTVLTDEYCVLKKKGNIYYGGIFPVWPLNSSPGKMWEISGVFFLRKSAVNEINSFSKVDAIREMLPEAICFNNKRISGSREASYRKNVFNFLDNMFEDVYFRSLSFNKDKEVFQCLR